jgi:hypothetical protein
MDFLYYLISSHARRSTSSEIFSLFVHEYMVMLNMAFFLPQNLTRACRLPYHATTLITSPKEQKGYVSYSNPAIAAGYLFCYDAPTLCPALLPRAFDLSKIFNILNPAKKAPDSDPRIPKGNLHSLENIVSFSARTSNSWVQVLRGCVCRYQ